VEELKIFYVIP